VNRRSFFKTIAAAPAAAALRPSSAEGRAVDLPKAKITRVRIYRPPNLNPLFNQSTMVATVETDAGITGIGEGGSKDTLEQCAGSLIGKNPFHTDAIWQEMYISWFYPPGARRRTRWARSTSRSGTSRARRSACRCTNCWAARRATTASAMRPAARGRPGVAPDAPLSLKERARATMEAGYRAFRMAPADPPIGGVYDTRAIIRQVAQDCRDVREAVGARRQLVHRLPPAVRPERRPASLQGDRGIRSVLRRGSGPRRERAAGHPEAAADDDGPADARRRVGPQMGLQQARREP
jgi:hypothetical protein